MKERGSRTAAGSLLREDELRVGGEHWVRRLLLLFLAAELRLVETAPNNVVTFAPGLAPMPRSSTASILIDGEKA